MPFTKDTFSKILRKIIRNTRY